MDKELTDLTYDFMEAVAPILEDADPKSRYNKMEEFAALIHEAFCEIVKESEADEVMFTCYFYDQFYEDNIRPYEGGQLKEWSDGIDDLRRALRKGTMTMQEMADALHAARLRYEEDKQ
jgi:hypothetical protein